MLTIIALKSKSFLVSKYFDFRNCKLLEEQNLKGVKTSHVLSIPRQNDESSNSICDFFCPSAKMQHFFGSESGA